MDCTRCKKILDKDQYSYKNEEKKIYYVQCNKCREKIKNNQDKQAKEKEQYENVKKENVIECRCGKTYVAFRDYHILRHNATKKHQQNIKTK